MRNPLVAFCLLVGSILVPASLSGQADPSRNSDSQQVAPDDPRTNADPEPTVANVPPPNQGANYYVAPDGDNQADGSLAHPWQTLQRAANVVAPGDTVHVRAGTYGPVSGQEYVVQLTASGTASAPIVFQPSDDEHVVLDATSNGTRRNWGVYVNGADHVVIRGFEIQGAKRAGIRLTGSDYFVVSDCTVHDVRDTGSVNNVVGGIMNINGYSHMGVINRNEVYDCSLGIVVRNEGGQAIEDIIVERNYIHDIHWWSTQLAYNNKNADGVVLNTTRHVTVQHNVIARCGDDGIDCYNSVNAVIESNTVYNSGDVMSNAPTGSNGDGNGIKVSTGGGGGHLIAHNLAFNCERAGFDQDHVDPLAPGNLYYHNVSFGNGRNGWIVERASSTPTVFRNNVAAYNNQDNAGYHDVRVVAPAAIDTDYNCWGDGAFPSVEGAHTISGNPGWLTQVTPGFQVNAAYFGIDLDRQSLSFGTVPAFSLDLVSPCINSGMDVGFPYAGSAPDLGAYEKSFFVLSIDDH